MSERTSGVLLHITSLPSEYGIGDLGPGAYRFVDFLNRTGQCYWQILPINPTDVVSGHSPYSSFSAFAGNVFLVSPELLVENGLLNEDEISLEHAFSSTAVVYDDVMDLKMAILSRAYQRFCGDRVVFQRHGDAFNTFVFENAFWLEDYALFVTIRENYNGKGWVNWPKELRDRKGGALSDFAGTHSGQINKIKFFQYLFFMQWKSLRKYCQDKGVRLLGDLAIYMNLDSVDVWRYPQNFKLDSRRKPVVVAGVPPDYFSGTGQRWGNPVYDWGILEDSQFSWWVERFRFNFRLFDIVRIDHFRGLVQYWEIPACESTAVNGGWSDVPTDNFFKTLESYFSKPLPIIAEDLGYITEDVRDAMRRFGFPGMKVLLFAFNGSMKDHPYLPHNFKEPCAVYTGTHDNNTVLGWFENEATEEEIRNVQEYIGKKISAETVHWDFIRLAFDSSAEIALIPMQDILGLGSEARMNKPATINGNWCWRVSADAFTQDVISQLRDVTIRTGRSG